MTQERSAELFVTDWQLSEQESESFVAHGTRDEFFTPAHQELHDDVLGLGRDERIRQHLAEVLRRYTPVPQ